jgi:hypothetical protein
VKTVCRRPYRRAPWPHLTRLPATQATRAARLHRLPGVRTTPSFSEYSILDSWARGPDTSERSTGDRTCATSRGRRTTLSAHGRRTHCSGGVLRRSRRSSAQNNEPGAVCQPFAWAADAAMVSFNSVLFSRFCFHCIVKRPEGGSNATLIPTLPRPIATPAAMLAHPTNSPITRLCHPHHAQYKHACNTNSPITRLCHPHHAQYKHECNMQQHENISRSARHLAAPYVWRPAPCRLNVRPPRTRGEGRPSTSLNHSLPGRPKHHHHERC